MFYHIYENAQMVLHQTANVSLPKKKRFFKLTFRFRFTLVQRANLQLLLKCFMVIQILGVTLNIDNLFPETQGKLRLQGCFSLCHTSSVP